MKLLVITQDDALATLIRDTVVKRGHEPLTVPSAEAACAILEVEPPEGMLLDISLPGMSGLDFLQLNAVRNAGVPTVVISGLVTDAQAREALRLGAIDAVSEPACLDLVHEVLAYLEVRVNQLKAEGAEQPGERRRSPRPAIALPIRVVESKGLEWQGLSINLGTFGVKVKPHAPVTPGASVRLQFTLPDDDMPLFVLAQLVRTEGDEHAYRFVNLTRTEYQRLHDLIQRLKTE
jgi:DNA-binding response OmpR family regulator